jgi:hypothetical protein
MIAVEINGRKLLIDKIPSLVGMINSAEWHKPQQYAGSQDNQHCHHNTHADEQHWNDAVEENRIRVYARRLLISLFAFHWITVPSWADDLPVFRH